MSDSPDRCVQRPFSADAGSGITAPAITGSGSRAAAIRVCGGFSHDPFTARKQQALVLLLVQQLADAQIRRADQAGSERLWQEVAALEIDPERITALLYSGLDANDREALRREDERWLAAQSLPPSRGWSLKTLPLARPWQPQRAFSRA
ncbi:MAG: hypothetical protein RLZZ11_1331 [Cyanobacteriota bacterium]|jgi:hypothetical protein